MGAFNGLVTNVTMLQTDFPTRGLNGSAVNVGASAAAKIVPAWCLHFYINVGCLCMKSHAVAATCADTAAIGHVSSCVALP